MFSKRRSRVSAQPGFGAGHDADAGDGEVRIGGIVEPVGQEAAGFDAAFGTVIVPQDQRFWNIGGIGLGHANPLPSVQVSDRSAGVQVFAGWLYP